MPRDPIPRMDIATDWAWQRRTRHLRSEYPEAWSHYWAAYMGLLAEAWRSADRSITLRQAWIGDLPCRFADAREALRTVGLIDDDDCIPVEAWDEWAQPAIDRILRRRASGSLGGRTRASNASSDASSETSSDASSSASTHPPTHPHHPQRASSEAGETFMGFRLKPGTHLGQHDGCAVCEPHREAYLASRERKAG